MGIFNKLGMNDKLAKNFWALIIVACSGAIIYGLPYFRYDYYDAYLQVYNLTDTQMGVFGSILGIFGMISYLFGGIVADRFSVRTIMTVSLVGTGLGGFVHLLPLGYHQLLVLYAFWGCSSLFAFWPCCIKAVRVFSGSGDQGKAFGFFEGGRGVGAAVMASGAVIAFKIGSGAIDDQVAGMKAAIIFYSVLTIIMGILCFFTIKEGKMGESDRVSFKGVGELLKMPAVWIIGLVIFSNYVLTLSLYYFTPYMTEILGASVVAAATLAAVKRWYSIGITVVGGYVTDKVGTGKILLVSFIGMIAAIVAILLLPPQASSIVLFIILFMIVYSFYCITYSMTWAMLDEGSIPERLSGSAAGLISTVGYLPEIFISLVAGKTLDAFPGIDGYRYYFSFVIGALVVGLILVIVWIKFLGKNKAKNDEK